MDIVGLLLRLYNIPKFPTTLPNFNPTSRITQTIRKPPLNKLITMDYKRFYEYLETRPLDEIKDCMENVVGVFNRQNPESLSSPKIKSSESTNLATPELERLRVAQRIWTQQAVWHKFGSKSGGHASSKQQAVVTSQLLTEPSVAEFIVSVNKNIDEAVKQELPSSLSEISMRPKLGGFASHRLIQDRYF